MTEPLKPGADHNQQAAAFRVALLQSGLMLSAGGDEIPGFSGEFELVLDAANGFISRLFADRKPEVMRFPALMSRKTLEKSRYVEGFPQLAGLVHCFCGSADDHKRMLACIAEGASWTEYREQTNAVLTPAACYPVYPIVASRGALAAQGCIVDVSSYCFRHEPSIDPVRLQMFRQRELVMFGTPAQVGAFIELWLDRAIAGFASLGLEVDSDIANDAFFGRFSTMLSTEQRAQRLKTEILIPVSYDKLPTACASCNNHKQHFSAAFGIRLGNGDFAATACAGFGMERFVLALYRRHGLALHDWPADVRRSLHLAV